MNFYLLPVSITTFGTLYHLYHQGALQSRLSCDCPELLPALAEFLSSPEGQQFNPFHF